REPLQREFVQQEIFTLLLVRDAVKSGQDAGLVRRDLDAFTIAHGLWSTMHGLTSLAVAGLLVRTAHGQDAVLLEGALDSIDRYAVDPTHIAPSFVRSPISLAEFVAHVKTIADDVGVISIDHPALAHEREEILYVYPHTRSLVVMIAEENKPSLQSRYLPTAN